MVSVILSSLVQISIVLVVGCAAYFAIGGRRSSFWRLTGLYAAPFRAVGAGSAVGLVIAAAILSIPGIAELASARGTVAGEASNTGLSITVALSLIITAVFKTSLSEELLFRGIIGKALIALLGFRMGNLIQATLFGLVHLLLFLVPKASSVLVLVMVLVTGISGWINGWINERWGEGSILPGWAAHAVANVCAYLWLAGRIS